MCHIFLGGRSSGCPDNAGAAGTLYEAVPKSLIVSNNNLSTQTDTLLLEFPNQPLWTNVFVRNRAKVAVPLLWSRVQVCDFVMLSWLNSTNHGVFSVIFYYILLIFIIWWLCNVILHFLVLQFIVQSYILKIHIGYRRQLCWIFCCTMHMLYKLMSQRYVTGKLHPSSQ